MWTVHFDPPDELPVLEREVVRVVVVDADDRVLLLHTHDPTYPELGTWWELPGGGIEHGESVLDAAVRELHEETSIFVDRSSIGVTRWDRHASFRYRGTRHVQRETVLTVTLDISEPSIDGSHRVGFEDEDYFDFSWWELADIETSDERFYPGSLPLLLRRHLAGESLDEPFELWS